jgi:phosphatidylserine/phosphatidylglycerophosphate/cardiolipin synthase-like enzyme
MRPQTKEKIYLSVIIFLIALAAQFYFTYQYKPTREVRVYYNRQHELNSEIINIIRDADQYVYFAIYTFTRSDIRDALLAANYRGVKIRGITDKNQMQNLEQQRDLINSLKKAGIPVIEQDHSALMHIKTIVTEKAYASGSYNWTSAATFDNDEILEVGTDESSRKQYQQVLEDLLERYN